MQRMRFAALLILAALAFPVLALPALADEWQDCKQSDADKAIAACTDIIAKVPESDKRVAAAYTDRGIAYRKKDVFDKAIADYSKAIELEPKLVRAYIGRGNVHNAKREFDTAIADYNKAMQFDPKSAGAYIGRGNGHYGKRDFDLAIADYTKAIELDPKYAPTYSNRGLAHNSKKDYDLAIADHTKAVETDPKYAFAFHSRGISYSMKRDLDAAIADYTKAIEIDAKYVTAYYNRGLSYSNRKDFDRSIADYSKAIELNPKYALAYQKRSKDYEAKGNRDAAVADLRKIMEMPVTAPADRERQDEARERIKRLTDTAAAPNVAPKVAQRVALVIGNSKYAQQPELPNPANDAKAIAAALGRLGFVVSEHYDLTRERMGRALKDFGDQADGAEWAVVFYAGHGVQMNGNNFLVPVDAELKRDSHIPDEAISLAQVQAKVDAATKLGLVILDACRNNPFLTRMVRTGGAASRSVAGGLAPVEPDGNVMVAFATKDGSTALDGDGAHSPYTEALLAHIEEPGLELGFLFRKVGAQVRKNTDRKQIPFEYGSLGGDPLYFKVAAKP